MIKIIYILFLFITFQSSSYSKNLIIEGNTKLNIDDIQNITSIDIEKNDFSIDDLNLIIKELYLSDLIFELSYAENKDSFIIYLTESNIIESIYINSNLFIDDKKIFPLLKSKQNYLVNKNSLKKDMNLITNLYYNIGFKNVLVNIKIEKYSKDRINLIFDVNEGKQNKISLIEFIGNEYFSGKYLQSILASKSNNFYNFFSSGSNFNPDIFEFDKTKIIAQYKDSGFFDVDVSYSIDQYVDSNNNLKFYISEGNRYKINLVEYDILNDFIYENIEKYSKNFDKDLAKNDYNYDQDLIFSYIEKINLNLTENNINNFSVELKTTVNDGYIDLIFYEKEKKPLRISNISISGNTITKDKTIRSKLTFEPGDYYNKTLIDNTSENLNKFSYINDVKINQSINSDLTAIDIAVDENKKTGNIILASTFDADRGFGISFGVEDNNIFGSGNRIKSNFSGNSEDLKYDIGYSFYPTHNPYLTNTFSIYNKENDLTSSFGFKSTKQGLGYSLKFQANKEIEYLYDVKYEYSKGSSPSNNNIQSITDNINSFNNINFGFQIIRDKTNNIFSPTNGSLNSISFSLSPDGISDSSFYKLILTNKNYFKFKNTDSFIFFTNNYGYADGINQNLKTVDAFSLGGMNFKGFDYRGIGPFDQNIYLGGNEYLTSTIGYGSSFLFDSKDNINIKLFLTTGSIWGSDYSTSNDFKLRSSAGLSFDFITSIGPISFAYAVPLEKISDDKTRNFAFSIGTSF